MKSFYILLLLWLLAITGCANGNHARDYLGARHGAGLNVKTDFSGTIANKNYVVLRGDVVLEKNMEKDTVLQLLGQPDEIKMSVAQQEIWVYKSEPVTLVFDNGFLTRWTKA